jgi:predicted DNA repair protein MutK
MASGFFAILDDIGVLMDDVAAATKIASRKTAGILGDDLAVNAEKATGFLASRELPVLWSITKGSLINKVIIVPAALLLNVFFPAAVTIILIIGGFYLAFEGVEKILEFFFHRHKTANQVMVSAEQNDQALEKTKVRSAVTTDFILSAEIVIIALGSVADKSQAIQIMTVSAVALMATIGVYGIVALIVRMDDAGYQLIKKYGDKGFAGGLGALLVKSLPVIIKTLNVVGTIALILVSGGIFKHKHLRQSKYIEFDKAKAVIKHMITAFDLFVYLVAFHKAGDEKRRINLILSIFIKCNPLFRNLFTISDFQKFL